MIREQQPWFNREIQSICDMLPDATDQNKIEDCRADYTRLSLLREKLIMERVESSGDFRFVGKTAAGVYKSTAGNQTMLWIGSCLLGIKSAYEIEDRLQDFTNRFNTAAEYMIDENLRDKKLSDLDTGRFKVLRTEGIELLRLLHERLPILHDDDGINLKQLSGVRINLGASVKGPSNEASGIKADIAHLKTLVQTIDRWVSRLNNIDKVCRKIRKKCGKSVTDTLGSYTLADIINA